MFVSKDKILLLSLIARDPGVLAPELSLRLLRYMRKKGKFSRGQAYAWFLELRKMGLVAVEYVKRGHEGSPAGALTLTPKGERVLALAQELVRALDAKR